LTIAWLAVARNTLLINAKALLLENIKVTLLLLQFGQSLLVQISIFSKTEVRLTLTLVAVFFIYHHYLVRFTQ
jgi:hypothetical protein